ncbi:MAG: hypothetical protein ABIA93_03385 [Candidatus Woesearchaeota archaeon]
MDFTIGLLIFTLAAVLSFRILSNYGGTNPFDEVGITGNAVASDLLGAGFPEDWTNETAITLGLTTGNRLDLVKYQQLVDLGYPLAKQKLNARHDFYINFQNKTGVMNITGIGCGFGNPSVTVGLDCEPDLGSHENIVSIRRVVILNKQLVTLYVYTWQ